MLNPTVDTTARTTQTSGQEGRLIVSVSGRAAKKSKLKSMLKKKKDGAGGPGVIPNPLTAQQQSQLSMRGTKLGSTPGALPGGIAPQKLSNKPHRSTRATAKKLKSAVKMKVLKNTIAGSKKALTNAYKPMKLSRRPKF